MSAEQTEESVAEPQSGEPKGLLQPSRVGIYACLRSDYDPAADASLPPPPPPAAEEEEEESASAVSADVALALDDVDAALDVRPSQTTTGRTSMISPSCSRAVPSRAAKTPTMRSKSSRPMGRGNATAITTGIPE